MKITSYKEIPWFPISLQTNVYLIFNNTTGKFVYQITSLDLYNYLRSRPEHFKLDSFGDFYYDNPVEKDAIFSAISDFYALH